jgi:DEAD/DEAH box helicase domain-containing protein
MVSEFETTHEREQFENLSNLLKVKYDGHDDTHLLIANPTFDNRDIDAVFIKRDAISVIELKNYGGNLFIAENGDWKCDGITVKGGSNGKNPFMQVKLNKTGLCSVINTWFYKPYVNLSHVSAIVLFNRPIEIESSTISPQVNTWFKVTDMNGIINQLGNITSRSINYTNQDLQELIEKLNLTDCLVYKTNSSDAEIVEEIELAQQAIATIVLPQELEEIKQNIENLGFKTIRHFPIPERIGITRNISMLNLSANSSTFLNKAIQGEIWEHQFDAIDHATKNENICLATSTSSGKSIVFYTLGIEKLVKNPKAKILAVYPLRALAKQQEGNWEKALTDANLSNLCVGRIDGSNSGQPEIRKKILKDCSIVVITPDTIHMFLLGKLSDSIIGNSIKEFLTKTELIVLDEVHTYTGVFGSNSAYLYRRLNHTIDRLKGNIPQYIAASATINDPEAHLKKITGIEFSIITNDTSPKKATNIILIEPNRFDETLSNMNKLVGYFTQKTVYKGITFLDSRKMVEQVAVGVNRQMTKEENDELLRDFDFGNNSVRPYRSGFETEDSEEIQRMLIAGEIKSIISTSALELGIDVKELDLAILLGIPYSSTSFYQRIGRVGRIGCLNDGLIIIVNDNTVRSNTIFNDPKRLFEIPMAEGALYLENENLQYIHALCFAEENGEYDSTNADGNNFNTNIEFPDTFLSICREVRNHNTSSTYDEIRNNGGTYAQFSYPLRDLEPQFKVKVVRGGQIIQNLGNLSRSQVQREAYPGAIYYYNTKSFRIIKIDQKLNEISARAERRYFTKPMQLPTMVFPQLRGEKIFSAVSYGDLKVLESEIQVYERIEGFIETRGSTNYQIKYPIARCDMDNIIYDRPNFSRDYKTTGTIISHPALNAQNVKSDIIAQLIYEIFLLNVPFEKQDVSFAKNKFKDNTLGYETDSRFIAIYDQSFGSLSLTRRLSEFSELRKVLDRACELLNDADATFSFVDNEGLNQETIEAVIQMRDCLSRECEEINLQGQNKVCVIKPGSLGRYNNHEVTIKDVLSTEKGLKYRFEIPINGGFKSIVASVNDIERIEESEIGIYNFETYDIED